MFWIDDKAKPEGDPIRRRNHFLWRFQPLCGVLRGSSIRYYFWSKGSWGIRAGCFWCRRDGPTAKPRRGDGNIHDWGKRIENWTQWSYASEIIGGHHSWSLNWLLASAIGAWNRNHSWARCLGSWILANTATSCRSPDKFEQRHWNREQITDSNCPTWDNSIQPPKPRVLRNGCAQSIFDGANWYLSSSPARWAHSSKNFERRNLGNFMVQRVYGTHRQSR